MKKDDLFTKKSAEHVKKAIELKYGTKRGNQTLFRKDLNKVMGYPVEYAASGGYLDKKTLSWILSGKTRLAPDRADAFSKVLGVPPEYLMGLTDSPNIEAHAQEMMAQWDKEDFERICKVKNILSELSKRGYAFRFELTESYESKRKRAKTSSKISAYVISQNMIHTLYDNDSVYTLKDEEFLYWMIDPVLLGIPVKKDDKTKYYHLNGKITVKDKRDRIVETDINGFMRLIYDIDESINNTINNRVDSWFVLSKYDYMEDFKHEDTSL